MVVMKKFKFASGSLKQKMMIIFSFFLAVSAVFSLFMYNYSTRMVRDSIIEKNKLQAEFFVESVDSQIAAAEEMVHNLLFDRRLSYLILPNSILNDYELMQAYLAQQERMKNLILGSSLIESSTIYLPNQEKKITDSLIGEMQAEDFLIVKKLYKDATKTMIYSEGQLYIAATGFYYIANKAYPDILFVVTFSAEKIANNLSNFNLYPGSISLFQMDETHFISDNTQKELLQVWQAEIYPKLVSRSTLENYNRNLSVDKRKYRVLSISSQYLGVFYQLIPYDEIFGPVNRAHFILFLYLVAMSVVVFYVSRYLNNHVHYPLNILTNLFRKVEAGDLEENRLNYPDHGTEFNYVFASFHDMKERLNLLINEVYVQKNLAQKAELKQLQSQINPHFLYNSFFSLNRKLKREDFSSAAKLAEHLGTYFQFLSDSGADIVTLEEEILHAKSYSAIQQIRFYDRIQVSFEELPEQFEKKAVPRLILQPVIENAFKYGLENLEADGKLSVRFFANNKETLIICVDDNGEDLKEAAMTQLQDKLEDPNHSDVSGLVNIHRRLKIYFGESSGVAVQRNKQNGMKVTITLVFKES